MARQPATQAIAPPYRYHSPAAVAVMTTLPLGLGIEMMNDAVRLLDHLKIDKAHIVGYSMSSGTGLLLALHHGKRVRTLS